MALNQTDQSCLHVAGATVINQENLGFQEGGR